MDIAAPKRRGVGEILGVGERIDFVTLCYRGYLSQCYIGLTHFGSGSASIFQQFMDITAPKRRGVGEIPHPHAAHLPYLPEPRL